LSNKNTLRQIGVKNSAEKREYENLVTKLAFTYYAGSSGYLTPESKESVRKIGERLNEIGGTKLMMRAFDDFIGYDKKSKPLMVGDIVFHPTREAAMSLTTTWVGVGNWGGANAPPGR
jgi:hypothetical protein